MTEKYGKRLFFCFPKHDTCRRAAGGGFEPRRVHHFFALKTGKSAPNQPRFVLFCPVYYLSQTSFEFLYVLQQKRERYWLMADTHTNRRKNKLQGTLRQRTRNGYYSYRLATSNSIRKEFALQTRNYDEAIQKAAELDSVWLAPTQTVALAHAVAGQRNSQRDWL